MTRAAYIWDESDTQGPWVLKCEACIVADGAHEVADWDAPDGWRCACCGAEDLGDDTPLLDAQAEHERTIWPGTAEGS